MPLRLLVTANDIKISRPGYDVRTASEIDLLLSLNARNMQVIQRGHVGAYQTSNPNYAKAAGWFSVSFPWMPEPPSVICFPITRYDTYAQCSGALTGRSYYIQSDIATYGSSVVDVGNSSFHCYSEVARTAGSYVTCGNLAYDTFVDTLMYVVFRKRFTG